jgi:hypothetical protein
MGKLMVGLRRFLLLCAVLLVLPAVGADTLAQGRFPDLESYVSKLPESWHARALPQPDHVVIVIEENQA